MNTRSGITRGPETLLGYWDGLGYTRCLVCVDRATPAMQAPDVTEIWSGNGAAEGVACDTCHTPLLPGSPAAR